jgi:hypothetical protein
MSLSQRSFDQNQDNFDPKKSSSRTGLDAWSKYQLVLLSVLIGFPIEKKGMNKLSRTLLTIRNKIFTVILRACRDKKMSEIFALSKILNEKRLRSLPLDALINVEEWNLRCKAALKTIVIMQ